jgi:hypothetical protein
MSSTKSKVNQSQAFKVVPLTRSEWLTPVILAAREAENRRMEE